MAAGVSDELLRRLRLAAQGLTPATAAAGPVDAARAVVGVQAQDVRAAALALRCRVPGLRRAGVDGSRLVRTWTLRGTVHLHDPADLPWLDAVLGPRNRARFEDAMRSRGDYEVASGLLGDLVELLDGRPLDRASLLAELAGRGHPALRQPSVNVLMPWAAARGLVAGLPDGRYRAGQPPPAVDAEVALATLARRYLAGYGPASAADLAWWSGLPLATARRALAAAAPTETAGELFALPGTFDAAPPAAPPALLLAAFDTTMLGYRRREPLVAAGHDRRVLPGGGMLRPVVLVDGHAAGTWGVRVRAGRPAVGIEWFGDPAPSAELDAEMRRVEAFLAPVHEAAERGETGIPPPSG
jgi:Winged helix DNA-binding domain